jgi:Na+-transporting methylmalonyl-CoA/oxaloacetate decarboxylase gamma subunit
MSDEIQITILGITVVFLGLILTSMLIYSFSFFQKFEEFKRRKHKKSEPKEQKTTINIESDIIAVLTAILEIELRLKISLDESKFTFNQK